MRYVQESQQNAPIQPRGVFYMHFSHTFCAGNSGSFLIKTWAPGGMVGLLTVYGDKERTLSGQNTNKSPAVHNDNYITTLSRNHCKNVIYGVYAKFYLDHIDLNTCNKNRPYGRFYLFCGILLLLR